MQLTPIPYLFVRELVSLSWRDALWGYEHRMLGWSDIVNLAVDRLCAGSDDLLEIELASLTKSEASQVGDLLRKLVEISPEGNEALGQKKWLYLILAWLFENKASVSDPLATVETIYADFDYPVEIGSFVRYMPPMDQYDPSIHSKEENEARLYEKWRSYLDRMCLEFAKD
jgi:hypothetical protein